MDMRDSYPLPPPSPIVVVPYNLENVVTAAKVKLIISEANNIWSFYCLTNMHFVCILFECLSEYRIES